jgi:hypothetical protein
MAMDNPETQDDPVSEDEPAHQDNLVSHVHTASPPVVEKEGITPEPTLEKAHDDVVITGEQHGAPPEASMALAKIIAKNESPSKEKGKSSLHFLSFEDLDVNSLHQGYLTRLLESRETEIAMINTLKRKFEVCLVAPSFMYIYVASKS